MPVRLSFLIVFFSALLLSSSPAFSAGSSAPSGEGFSPRCEAAIDKAAASYSECLLKASAQSAKKGDGDRLFARQMRCEDKWSARVARVQGRFGQDQCTPYTSNIADRTVTCAEKVSIEAGGKAATSRIYVQGSAGGSLTETTLVLYGIEGSTGWFTERPYRDAGRMTTAEFVALFSEDGANSFAASPPNADFTCESDGELVDYVVELTDPVPNGNDLSYTVALVSPTSGEDGFASVTCDADAHLFIDDGSVDATWTPPYPCWCSPRYLAGNC